MRLLPRQERFYELFLGQAALILKASELILNGVRAGNSALPQRAAEIKDVEREGDSIIHETVEKLNKTFLTPIDPEDIHRLAGALDDVLDGIEDSAHRMASHGLAPIPPDVIRLCELVHQGAEQIKRALDALAKEEPVTPHCIEINRLEDEADQVYRSALSSLFATETDPISLIRQREVYESLERTVDLCEDVADILQNIAVKNG